MDWRDLSAWLETTWLHEQMIGTYWLMPTMETLHFIALSILLGALLVVDLRVMGVAKSINIQAAMRFIPLAIGAFSINLLTGICFIFALPYRYFPNSAFQWKMGLIFIAGINALWFWFGEHKDLMKLREGEDADLRAKVIATLSLLIWIAVIVFGRFIPFVEF